MGMGGVCGEAGGGRREEREGEGEEKGATDSIEPQNFHNQSPSFWLGSSLSQNQKSFEMLPLVQTRNHFELCDFSCEGECHFGTYHRDAWLVIFDCWRFSSVLGIGPRQGERHGFGGLENTPFGQRGTDPKR